MILRPGKFIDARKSGGPEASLCGYPDASDSDMPSAPLWGVPPTIHLGRNYTVAEVRFVVAL
jgi:hypothetical protein